MKCACPLIALWLLSSAALSKVPTGTHEIGELERARDEAAKRGKALAFLVSDPESKYSNTRNATATAIKELRSYAVVVFLVSKKDGETAMPPPVVTALRKPTMGTFDPRLVLMSADLTETFAALGNKELVGNDARDTYRDLKETMRTKLAAWKPSGKPPADEFIWIRTDGRHYRGRFVEVKDAKLHVESTKFGKGSLRLEELSPASRAYAEQLASVGTPQAQNSGKGESEPKFENWTSSDGKVVKARFISLQDGKLTVETATGKSYTFPLDRLGEKSQARAKALAGERESRSR